MVTEMKETRDMFWGIPASVEPSFRLARMVEVVERDMPYHDVVISDADLQLLFEVTRQCGYHHYELSPWATGITSTDRKVYWLQIPVSRDERDPWMRHFEIFSRENGEWSVYLTEEVSQWIYERIYRRGIGYRQIA